MRLYSFVNANYLKEIQYGLQTAHAVAELYNKNTSPCYSHEYEILDDWARHHKTIIILNGGDCQDLQEIYDFIHKNRNALKLPYAKFHEDERSLNKALTSVAIVVPPEIYDVKKIFETSDYIGDEYVRYELDGMGFWFDTELDGTSPKQEFYDLLKSKKLA